MIRLTDAHEGWESITGSPDSTQGSKGYWSISPERSYPRHPLRVTKQGQTLQNTDSMRQNQTAASVGTYPGSLAMLDWFWLRLYPDKVGGPYSWVYGLWAGRSCVGHMMDVSMGGLVQSQACCSNFILVFFVQCTGGLCQSSWMNDDFIPLSQTQCSGLGDGLSSMLGDCRSLRTDKAVFLGHTLPIF